MQILNNLQRFLKSLTDAERETLKDEATVRRALHDPILKLLATERPEKILQFKLSSLQQLNGEVLKVDDSKETFINTFTLKIIDEFRNHIVQLNKSNSITYI